MKLNYNICEICNKSKPVSVMKFFSVGWSCNECNRDFDNKKKVRKGIVKSEEVLVRGLKGIKYTLSFDKEYSEKIYARIVYGSHDPESIHSQLRIIAGRDGT